MDSEITIQQPLTLPGFCQTIVSKCSGNWPPTEQRIADEFLTFFQIDGLLRLDELEKLCEGLGVRVSVQELPTGLRGHNCAFAEKREILIGELEGTASLIGSYEHTLFHELRELIECEFRRIGHPVATASDLELRAETFAANVRALHSIRALDPLLHDIGNSQLGWGQRGLSLLVLLAVVVYAFVCLTLPHWEDQLPK